MTVKADTSNPHAITHTGNLRGIPSGCDSGVILTTADASMIVAAGKLTAKWYLSGVCGQFLHRGNFLMREVFIRQPFFPRILNQTLRPVRISFLNQCMMNIGITTAAWEMAQEPAIHHRSDTPFSQVCSCNDHSLVPVIAIDHAFKGFVWRTPRGAKIKMTEDKKEAYKCQSKMRLQ